MNNALRFQVLQADNFTCQYCGKKGEDAELQVDHIIPVSKGGLDEFENLITSCRACNIGKFDKEPAFRSRTELKTRIEMKAEYDYQNAAMLSLGKRKKYAEDILYFLASMAEGKDLDRSVPAIEYFMNPKHNFLEKYFLLLPYAEVKEIASNLVDFMGGPQTEVTSEAGIMLFEKMLDERIAFKRSVSNE